MSTNYANFAFWFYFDFQTKKVERSAEKGEERRSRSFLLAFWHCNTIDKIPDRHRHTSTQTHTHTRKEIFNLRLVYLINLLDICSSALPFVLIKFVLLLQLLLFLLLFRLFWVVYVRVSIVVVAVIEHSKKKNDISARTNEKTTRTRTRTGTRTQTRSRTALCHSQRGKRGERKIHVEIHTRLDDKLSGNWANWANWAMATVCVDVPNKTVARPAVASQSHVESRRIESQEHCRAARPCSCWTSYRLPHECANGSSCAGTSSSAVGCVPIWRQTLALPVASAALPASASCHRRLLPCNSFSPFTSLLSSARHELPAERKAELPKPARVTVVRSSPRGELHNSHASVCRLMWRMICLRFLFTFQAASPLLVSLPPAVSSPVCQQDWNHAPQVCTNTPLSCSKGFACLLRAACGGCIWR